MLNNMYRFQYLILLFLAPVSLMAQEHLTALHTNRKVMVEAQKMMANHTFKRPTSATMVTLPFKDDFSKPGPYPDTSYWIDKDVYVNYGSPVCPPTLGVAEFDGLDSIGKPYFPSNSPYASSPGDKLTSKPISWAKTGGPYAIGDSVYLSFYYQAGSYFGKNSLGQSQLYYYPNTADSLLLQFKAVNSITWNTIWYHLGYTAADSDTTFHMVMIPFDTGTYFKSFAEINPYFVDGFQFRFLAYSCGTGNVDHWNIDEVYLGAAEQQRSYVDTTQNDIAFVYEAPPMLANYSLEPWEQYQKSDLASTMNLTERNNRASKNVSPLNIINTPYNYTINTNPQTQCYGGSGASANIYPFVDSGYNKSTPQAHPKLDTTNFPASFSGPTTYTITHYFDRSGSGDFDFWNDTVRYNQVFNNVYAYDDGSAEYGYEVNGYPGGLSGGGVPVYLAEQFTLNKPDSIFGLDIYFDYIFVSNTSYTFKITLWNDNGGLPGNMIYQDSVLNPSYGFVNNSEFTTYYFKPQYLPAGKFYVGWEQTSTTADSLNIGFDFNSDHSSKLFYSYSYISQSDPNWQGSDYPGTLMIRPIMGSPIQYVGINNVEAPATEVTIYPNPAQNEVTLNGDLRNATVRLMGADGRALFEDDNFSGNTINTSLLPNGFYIVQITPRGKQTVFKKLLISK
jgi:hypothetical protein